MFHCNVSNLDRENAKDLFNIILDDQFLFLIHMHYDLHESVLGKSRYDSYVTFIKVEHFNHHLLMMQHYSIMLNQKENSKFGAFKIKLGDRQNFSNDCREHISRLPEELTKRFTPSVVQENLSILFDPQYLIQHKNDISSIGYGRGVN
ncbi:unnamed protein product [Rotaria sordida]|uniref:Uncharacterized protein n=1 Tax=Rotaria sordida TaxID=392033 RepID=A0A814BCN0_9BILA|nr:unnamed protein product [Rotaria sordida]